MGEGLRALGQLRLDIEAVLSHGRRQTHSELQGMGPSSERGVRPRAATTVHMGPTTFVA